VLSAQRRQRAHMIHMAAERGVIDSRSVNSIGATSAGVGT
jgi:hypothetical protein